MDGVASRQPLPHPQELLVCHSPVHLDFFILPLLTISTLSLHPPYLTCRHIPVSLHLHITTSLYPHILVSLHPRVHSSGPGDAGGGDEKYPQLFLLLPEAINEETWI